MVGFQVIITMDHSRRHEFFQTFESLSRPEAREEGCLDQGLYDQIGWSNRLLWVENWKSIALLEAHMQSRRFQTIMGAIEVLGQVADIKILEFQAPAPVK
jgi:quinol monooxygenase YgiN